MIPKYNEIADGLYDKARGYLVGITKTELEEWHNHPATRSLLCTLEGDLLSLMINTSTGVYSNESSDVTVQAMAKAIGQTQTCAQIIEHIKDMGS